MWCPNVPTRGFCHITDTIFDITLWWQCRHLQTFSRDWILSHTKILVTNLLWHLTLLYYKYTLWFWVCIWNFVYYQGMRKSMHNYLVSISVWRILLFFFIPLNQTLVLFRVVGNKEMGIEYQFFLSVVLINVQL